MLLRSLVIVGWIFLSTVCIAQVPGGTNKIRIVGSSTVENAILEPMRDRIRATTGLELEIHAKGSGMGMVDLAKGRADVAGVSEGLEDALESAQKAAQASKQSFDIPKNLVHTELGRDRIVVIVNKANKVQTTLSTEQLKSIFTRKITNWKELGGADEKIVLVTGPLGSATFATFRKAVLDGANIPEDSSHTTPELKAFSTASEIPAVQKMPSAIAVVSQNVAKDRALVKVLNTPVIDRPLAFVTIGKPSAQVQMLIDYLRSEPGRAWQGR